MGGAEGARLGNLAAERGVREPAAQSVGRSSTSRAGMSRVLIEVGFDADVLVLATDSPQATGCLPDEVITAALSRWLRVDILVDVFVRLTLCHLSRS